MNNFMKLSDLIMDRLTQEELVWVNGGAISGSDNPNNGGGVCSGPNNNDGLCSGTNNHTGRCGETNNSTGMCQVTDKPKEM